MGTRKPEDIRSVGIVAHGGAGKTSLTEAMLFDAGAITRMGRPEDKNTVSDFDPEEQKRQISISSSLVTLSHQDKKLFILDNPGFADFVGEQLSALRAVDTALIVVSGASGIEVQTQKVWDYAEQFGLAVMFYVSKLDRENTDFDAVMNELREGLSDRAMPLFLPIGKEMSFKGLVDVLANKAYLYKADGSKNYTEAEVPADMADACSAAREALVERIVEADDAMMERYLEGEEIALEDLLAVLRKAVASRTVFPVIPGSNTLNVGVVQLLDSIAQACPSPMDMPPRKAFRGEAEVLVKPGIDEPFSAQCFKVMVDPYVGKLSFIRVFSGKLTSDQTIYNVSADEEERISSFRLMKGKDGEETKEIMTGEIVAIPKLDSTAVGNTLGVKGKIDFKFPKIMLPKPVYSVAVFPKSRADEDKLGNAMNKILNEDRTLEFAKNPETGDSVFSGMGDMHLDIMLSRIKERYKVDLDTRTPKVPYRETIKKTSEAQGKYKKQTGGRGQYGDVWFRLAPTEKGNGVTFEDKVVGGVVPKNFIPAAEKGLREAAAKGVIAGYPAVDFNCQIFDGSYHDVDSSEMAFKIAASMAFKKAFTDALPILMEPIMNVVVTVPEECLGDVMGDFNGRRGRIMGIDSEGKLQVVKAQCPLAELFRYAIILRSMTSGRGSFTMEFSHYEEVPADIAKKVIEIAAKDKQEEEE